MQLFRPCFLQLISATGVPFSQTHLLLTHSPTDRSQCWYSLQHDALEHGVVAVVAVVVVVVVVGVGVVVVPVVVVAVVVVVGVVLLLSSLPVLAVVFVLALLM